MATKKASTKKTTAKQATAKKSAEKKAPASAPAKKAAEKKTTTAKKATAKDIVEKKPAVKEIVEKKAPAASAPAPIAREAIAKPPTAPARPVSTAPSGITTADAQQILADVRASQKHAKGPCRAALPLRFTNLRKPSRVGELGPHELRQLVAAGVDGTDEVRTPEGWLDPEERSGSFYGRIEVWDVVDAHGIPVYAVWMYLTDDGTVFRAGTIDVVGGVSNGALECAEEGLEEALLDAKSRVDKKVLQGSLLRAMG